MTNEILELQSQIAEIRLKQSPIMARYDNVTALIQHDGFDREDELTELRAELTELQNKKELLDLKISNLSAQEANDAMAERMDSMLSKQVAAMYKNKMGQL